MLAVTSLICVGSFPLWSSALLSNEKIQFIVTNVMHKNISLSGRMYIYSYINRFLRERQWYGYGYSNNIVEQTLGFGNIQNWIIRYCIVLWSNCCNYIYLHSNYLLEDTK